MRPAVVGDPAERVRGVGQAGAVVEKPEIDVRGVTGTGAITDAKPSRAPTGRRAESRAAMAASMRETQKEELTQHATPKLSLLGAQRAHSSL